MRILIVDDDATTLMFFEQALVEDGYDVSRVSGDCVRRR
jgi:DNA-binding response OmpR family regulator